MAQKKMTQSPLAQDLATKAETAAMGYTLVSERRLFIICHFPFSSLFLSVAFDHNVEPIRRPFASKSQC